MKQHLRILIVEDSDDDAELIIRHIEKRGYRISSQRVDTAEGMSSALSENSWDLVLCDHKMPLFDSQGALAVMQEMQIDLPFIIVSGSVGEEKVVELMRSGAHDFILKGALLRLVPVIERELREAEVRQSNQLSAEALNESERKYRLIVDNTDIGFVTVDEAGIVLEANESYARFIGAANSDEVIGRSVIEWTAPDEQENNATAVTQCVKQGYIQDFETIYLDKDDNRRNILINATVADTPDGKRLYAFCRDITDRKRAEVELQKAEKRFRELYDSTSDTLMLLDEKGFFACNQATLSMFGCATEEEFCSKHPVDFSPAEQPDGSDSMIAAGERIETAMKEGSNRFEWVHKRNDTGEEFQTEVLLTAMEIEGRQVLQAAVRDVTERKQSEKEREVLNEIGNLVHTTSNLDELLAGIHQNIKKVMYAENCFVALYDPKTDMVSFPYFADQFDPPPTAREKGKGFTGYILQTGKPLLFTPELFETLVTANEISVIGTLPKSFLGAPLFIKSEPMGVLVVQSYEKEEEYTKQSSDLLAA